MKLKNILIVIRNPVLISNNRRPLPTDDLESEVSARAVSYTPAEG